MGDTRENHRQIDLLFSHLFAVAVFASTEFLVMMRCRRAFTRSRDCWPEVVVRRKATKREAPNTCSRVLNWSLEVEGSPEMSNTGEFLKQESNRSSRDEDILKKRRHGGTRYTPTDR